ncbi:hypothetical protein AB0J08_41545, partial [Kitasatospora sp. NPDC050463]
MSDEHVAFSTALAAVRPYLVRQYGGRRRWDDFEQTLTWWHRAVEPGVDRLGLTVTPKCWQAWLDEPRPADLTAPPRPAPPQPGPAPQPRRVRLRAARPCGRAARMPGALGGDEVAGDP